jgi:uncharacterized protein YutE (UPF0331/DUF86 family)
VGELLIRKVLLCRDRIVKIRGALPDPPEAIAGDEIKEAFVSFHLLLLVQDALDLAAHLIAEQGLAIPSSQRESFSALAEAGFVAKDTAAAMGQMASLRNRIAHTYSSLDPVRMVREAPLGLEAVSRFLDEIVLSTTAAPPKG